MNNVPVTLPISPYDIPPTRNKKGYNPMSNDIVNLIVWDKYDRRKQHENKLRYRHKYQYKQYS